MEESKVFFGRSREIRELHSLIKVEPAVVLFSKSGIGKSSLLHAGVLPLLLEDGYSCLSLGFQNIEINPVQILLQELHATINSFSLGEMMRKRLQDWCGEREPSIWEYLKAAEMVMAYIPSKPLLVLEHFEAFFMHDLQAQDYFTETIADLIFGRVPEAIQQQIKKKQDANFRDEQWATPLTWKVIITIRSDQLSFLDSLSHHIPPILENCYQLHPLHREEAKEAILLPAASTSLPFASPVFDYTAEALAELLDNLSNEKGEIEPFQLQIICRHIEELVIAQNISTVTPALIGGAAGIKSILDNYYENCIALLGDTTAQHAAQKLIENGLIVAGVSVGLSESVIIAQYNISPELLQKIEASSIIKTKNRASEKIYELSQNTLVLTILNASEKRKRLEKEAEIEKEKIALYAEAAKERTKRRLSNILTIGAGTLAFIAICMGFGIWINGTKLSEKVKEEETLRTQAEEKSIKIEEALNSLASQNAEHFWVLTQESEEIIELNICPKDFLTKMKDISKAYSDSSRFHTQIKLLEKEMLSRKIVCD